MDLGNAFGWAFKDPRWFGKFVLIGLIGLIPIVGQMNSLGWMLTCKDHLAAGRTDLPEAGFDYIGRGANVFLVELIYGLVFVAIFIVAFIFLFAGAAVSGSAQDANPAASAMFGLGFAATFGLISVLGLALQLFIPALVVATEHGGIGGGLNLLGVARLVARRPGPALLSGVMFMVAGFIGGIGIYACCVGLLVSLPYAYAIQGATLLAYERELGLQPHPPAYPPPPTPLPPPPAMA